MAVIALFRSALTAARWRGKQADSCRGAPVAPALVGPHDEAMIRARAFRIHALSRAIVVALGVLLIAGRAAAEPGDDLPRDDATAQGSSNDQVLPSPSLPSQPSTQAPAPAAAGDAAASAPLPPENDPRALSDFEPQLSPYGAWVDDEKYGHVWVPDRSIVGEGFSPYATGGHWALDTDGNWVWVSDYAFGDIVFHYGRWAWTPYGWSWIPGYRYAPAWVSWRVPTESYAYVGWAPIPPSYVWFGGVGVSFWYAPPYYWVFCPSGRVFAPYPYRYFVTRPAYVRALGRYTRPYVAASPHLIPRGPPLQAALVPRGSVPATRVAAGPSQAFSNGSALSARSVNGHVAPATARSLPGASRAMNTSPSLAASRTVAPSRTWSEPARQTFSPAARVSAPPTRGPPPSVFAPARPTVAPSRVYSPPARAYTPSPRAYSAPARVYSPPARAYSAPRVYAPSRVYSAPAWHSSPSFSRPSPSFSRASPSFSHGSGGGGHHR